MRFSQSEVVLLSNLQNPDLKDKECSCEWFVNTDPGLQSFSNSLRFCFHYQKNQSVENAGVAFVKGADERNKFFEKNK